MLQTTVQQHYSAQQALLARVDVSRRALRQKLHRACQ